MLGFLTISIAAIICLFILFLVLSRTLNNIINQLAKIEYLLTNAFEYGKERLEVERLLAEQSEDLSSKE